MEEPEMLTNDGEDKFIIVTIDGEVVHTIFVSKTIGEHYQDRLISVFMSNPTFTLHDTAVPNGSTWDGQNFTSPVY